MPLADRLEPRALLALAPIPRMTPVAEVTFPSALIDGETRTAALPRFDSNLGQLLGLTVTASATLDATALLENAADQAATIPLEIGGSFDLTTPGLSLAANFQSVSHIAQVPAFDGALDLAGPGLITIAPDTLTTSSTQTRSLTQGVDDLSAYVGAGTFSVSFLPTGFAQSDDPNGNVLVQTELNAAAVISVAYRYVPFAISGKVYIDGPTPNGLHDASEPGIPGVTLILTGVSTTGEEIGPIVTQTDANGDYLFTDLKAGTYQVVEIQPPGFLDGDETRGNVLPLGNAVGFDTIPAITIGLDNPHAVQNNFGEQLPPPSSEVRVTAQVFGIHAQPSRVELTFSEPLEPARARNRADYRIATPGPDGRFQTRDDATIAIRSVTYNPQNQTVTLIPKSRLRLNRDYLVFAKGPGGVLPLGQPLVDGHGGRGDYSVVVQRGKQVAYTDSDGDRVTLRSSRGGVLSLFRSTDGAAQSLFVTQGSPHGPALVAHKSVLSGFVQRGHRGDGKVIIPNLITAVPMLRRYKPNQLILQ